MIYETKFATVSLKSSGSETLRRWLKAGLQYAARIAAVQDERVLRPTPSGRHCKYTIREARSAEFSSIGELTVNVYANLPGMPAVLEQANYYEALRNVADRASAPEARVLTAVSDSGELLGTVNFFADMRWYGGAGAVGSISNAAGIRYLAVKPEHRGSGIGRALTVHCIDVARQLGKSAVILHTTRAMPTAWAMYQRMGFERCAAIDFKQGSLEVFGLKLDLHAPASLGEADAGTRESAALGSK